MALVEAPPPIGRPALIARVKNILINPPREWETIDAEPSTIRDIYLGYVVYIAAIGPVCRFLGNVVFNHSPVVGALLSAIIGYGVELVVVYLVALLIDWLAPRYGGQSNRVQAFKVSAYSYTAVAVAGVFGLVPALSALEVVAFYGFLLMWLGLPRLMRVPQERALTCFAVVLIAMLVGGIVLALLLGRVQEIGRV